jgi:hypothetical protein
LWLNNWISVNHRAYMQFFKHLPGEMRVQSWPQWVSAIPPLCWKEKKRRINLKGQSQCGCESYSHSHWVTGFNRFMILTWNLNCKHSLFPITYYITVLCP